GTVVAAAGVALLALGCAAQRGPESDSVQIESIQATAEDKGEPLTELELQDLVMRMVDSYIAVVTQVSREMELTLESPLERHLLHSLKYNATRAAFDIAVSARPDEALLDLLVLVTLQRSAVERYWNPRVFQERGDVLLVMLRQLEDSCWRKSARALSPQQQQDLRALIESKVADSPEIHNVAQIRFSDFYHLQDESAAARATGLLSEINEASRAVDEAVLFGERAMWYSSRLPILLGYQVEKTVYDLLGQQDIRALLTDFTQYSDASDRVAVALEDLPEMIERERAATIDHFMGRVAGERTAFLGELDTRGEDLESTLHELRLTVDAGTALADALDTTFGSVDRVLARFDDTGNDSDRVPLRLQDLRDVAVETTAAADQLTNGHDPRRAGRQPVDQHRLSPGAPADRGALCGDGRLPMGVVQMAQAMSARAHPPISPG
ncbi:MAG: hypothetical protein ACYTE6_16550, partial [Planctomycetota bacterium]